jgi:hypothetical protein
MEVVLAEVEGRESRSSEDGDGDEARGMLSYDWSDMFAAACCGFCGSREGAFGWVLSGQERSVGGGCCYVSVPPGLSCLSEQSRCMTTHDSRTRRSRTSDDDVISLGTSPTLTNPRLGCC